MFRLSHTLSLDTQTYQFCSDRGLVLSKTGKCPTCRCVLRKIYKEKRLSQQRHEERFQCNKKKCKGNKNQVPIKRGSWCVDAKISERKSLLLAYCFAHKMTSERTIHEKSISSPESGSSESDTNHVNDRVLKTNKQTIADYLSYCWEICVWVTYNKIQKENWRSRNAAIDINVRPAARGRLKRPRSDKLSTSANRGTGEVFIVF